MPFDAAFNAKVQAAIDRHTILQHQHKATNPRYLQVLRKVMAEEPRAQVAVHVHDGPEGVGYTVYVHTVENGVKYRKAHGAGSHSYTHDWIIMRSSIPGT